MNERLHINDLRHLSTFSVDKSVYKHLVISSSSDATTTPSVCLFYSQVSYFNSIQ